MDVTIFRYGTDEIASLSDARVIYISSVPIGVMDDEGLFSAVRFRLDREIAASPELVDSFNAWYESGATMVLLADGSHIEGCVIKEYGINPARGRLFVTLHLPISFYDARELFSRH